MNRSTPYRQQPQDERTERKPPHIREWLVEQLLQQATVVLQQGVLLTATVVPQQGVLLQQELQDPQEERWKRWQELRQELQPVLQPELQPELQPVLQPELQPVLQQLLRWRNRPPPQGPAWTSLMHAMVNRATVQRAAKRFMQRSPNKTSDESVGRTT